MASKKRPHLCDYTKIERWVLPPSDTGHVVWVEAVCSCGATRKRQSLLKERQDFLAFAYCEHCDKHFPESPHTELKDCVASLRGRLKDVEDFVKSYKECQARSW